MEFLGKIICKILQTVENTKNRMETSVPNNKDHDCQKSEIEIDFYLLETLQIVELQSVVI